MKWIKDVNRLLTKEEEPPLVPTKKINESSFALSSSPSMSSSQSKFLKD